jgi:hypothetical protein
MNRFSMEIAELALTLSASNQLAILFISSTRGHSHLTALFPLNSRTYRSHLAEYLWLRTFAFLKEVQVSLASLTAHYGRDVPRLIECAYARKFDRARTGRDLAGHAAPYPDVNGPRPKRAASGDRLLTTQKGSGLVLLRAAYVGPRGLLVMDLATVIARDMALDSQQNGVMRLGVNSRKVSEAPGVNMLGHWQMQSSFGGAKLIIAYPGGSAGSLDDGRGLT